MPFKVRAPAELVGPVKPQTPKWRWLHGLAQVEWVTNEKRASIYASERIANRALSYSPYPRNADDLDRVELVRVNGHKERL